jgi:hypothetical protein
MSRVTTSFWSRSLPTNLARRSSLLMPVPHLAWRKSRQVEAREWIDCRRSGFIVATAAGLEAFWLFLILRDWRHVVSYLIRI